MDQNEEYRKIQNYNYSISNLGNVRNDKSNRILKQFINPNGYKVVIIYKDGIKQNFKLHRLIANAFLLNPDNKNCVDHIDQDKLNNSISNLRFATKSENCQNRKKQINNKSGVVGVHFLKKSNKWKSMIVYNNNKIYLGTFDKKEDAENIRIRKSVELFADFASNNEKNKLIEINLKDELEKLEIEFNNI